MRVWRIDGNESHPLRQISHVEIGRQRFSREEAEHLSVRSEWRPALAAQDEYIGPEDRPASTSAADRSY